MTAPLHPAIRRYLARKAGRARLKAISARRREQIARMGGLARQAKRRAEQIKAETDKAAPEATLAIMLSAAMHL